MAAVPTSRATANGSAAGFAVAIGRSAAFGLSRPGEFNKASNRIRSATTSSASGAHFCGRHSWSRRASSTIRNARRLATHHEIEADEQTATADAEGLRRFLEDEVLP
jgi:hypothetical protein